MERFKALGRNAQIGVVIVVLFACAYLINSCTGGDDTEVAPEATSGPQGFMNAPADSEEPATDVQPTDVPATEPPPTEVPATVEPPTEVPATDVPPTDPPPTDVPAPTAVPQPTDPPPPPPPSDCVDINSASFDELRRIINIDEVFAQVIIDGRPWRSVDALIGIKGIGQVKLGQIQEQGLACVR